MIYITVELNKDIYIKIPKVKNGISPYNLTMTSQAGGQQMVFTDLVDNSDKSSVYRFILNFTEYTPSGIYNYVLNDSADKQMSKGLIQVNMTNQEDYFYQDDTLGYFVEDEGGGDMSNYYTKSQIDSMLTQYEKKSDLPDFNNFVTLDQLSSQSYVTTEEMQTEVESYINSKDLINSTQLANTLEWYVTLNELQNMSYATEAYVMEKISQIPGGGISMNDVKDYVVSQSYVTSDYLNNVGYITTENVRDNYYNNVEIQEILTSYLTKEELSGMGYVTSSDIPTVNDATVTIKQGGDVMGSFTLNQSNNVEILLNEGGQGGGVTMNDVKQYVDSQSYVTSTSLNNMGYVTSSTLNDYATKSYVQEKINEIPGQDLSAYVKYSDLNNYGYITAQDIVNQSYVTNSDLTNYATKSYVQEKINEIPGVDLSAYVTKTDLVNQSYAKTSDISNAGIMIKQGGVLKGSFNLNQTSAVEINLDGGGSGGGVTMEEVKQYVVSQSYVISSTLNDYATKAYVQDKVNDMDLSSYVKYSDLNNYGYITAQDIVNQSYVTSSTLNDYATKSYVQEKINEIPGQDLSAYVTKTDLVNQSYITSSSLDNYATKAYVQEKVNDIDLSSYATKSDLNSYVKYSDLNNYGYQTSTQVQNTVNTSINSLNSYTLVFTLADDSTVTVIAYTK